MASSSAVFQVGSLLEKMGSLDKDFRFMAVNDLMREVLAGHIRLDDDTERKVVRALLKLLNDKNGEVQNLSVKCLGSLTSRMKEPQADILVDSLCQSMVTGADEERDVSSVALKAVVASLTPTVPSFTANIVRRLIPNMLQALTDTKPTDSVRLELLDIIADVLMRFGSSIQTHHEQIQSVLLDQLSSERQALRKRATMALGHLTAVCNSDLFGTTVNTLVERLAAARNASTVRTYIVSITSVSKSSGSRFAMYLSKAVPLLLSSLSKSDDDESKEAIMQAMEAFYYRCPREIASFHDEMQSVLLEQLAYDPNYMYDDDDDESMEVEDDVEDEEEEAYSDDDDMSWKVRRSAAKAIEAMIVSRRSELLTSIAVLGPILIGRMKEREESVRGDVFSAYVALLRQIRIVVPNAMAAVVNDDEPSVEVGRAKFSQSALSGDQLQLLAALHAQTESLVKAITKQMKSKSVKTRLSCFELLSELVRVLPGSLSAHLSLVLPGLTIGLTDKTGGAQTKIDGLSFLSHAIRSHEAIVFRPHLSPIVQNVVATINDSFYKVSAEGLSVAAQIIPVLKACEDDSLVAPLYEAVNEKLKCNDIDQDVKERAIAASGFFLALFGDVLGNKVSACLHLLLDRIRNEMTRLCAVRALSHIASGEVPAVLCEVIDPLLPLLADFLRKNQRALKIATLNLLEVLLVNELISGLDSQGLTQVVGEVPALINDADLQITQHALKCLNVAVVRFPVRVADHLPAILQSIIQLLQSALLQGSTLVATLDFIKSLVSSKVPGKPTFEDLLDQMTASVYEVGVLPRQALVSISASTAVVAAASDDISQACNLVSKLSDQLQNTASCDQIRMFCLQTIGELGRRCPMVYEKSPIKPAQLLVSVFNSPTEDLKTAAAQSIGALAVGNLSRFLPFILEQIETQPKRQYLLLHSLKEVISWESVDGQSIDVFREKIGEIWPVLIQHASCPEEGTRNVVAECLGKLCVVDPQNLLHKLKEHVNSSSANVRSCVVTSVKYMISGEKKAIDSELQANIGSFLTTIRDADLNVRRVALVVLNSAAHNKPSLVRDLLPELLPAIYGETQLRQELIREVEMGPFKHQVDDGLDLRKAAFECMYTMLESCLEKLDIFEFINHMESGLKDHHHDIRLLTFLMLIRLTGLCPGQVLQKIDRVCEQIKAQLNTKIKANAVKQEIEKLEELKRAAIRVLFALQNIPEAERQQQLNDVMQVVRATPELKTLSEQVQRDSQRTFVGGEAMETV